MHWDQPNQIVFAACALLVIGLFTAPASASSVGAPGFAPPCHSLAHLDWSLTEMSEALLYGMGGANTSLYSEWSGELLLGILVALAAILVCLATARYLLVLRAQRDAALREVALLEQLSERDPLTGLMNRRVVEERFGELRQQGFDTFALIDLDKFKSVNDRYGHQIGDQALIACANAIRGGDDRDSIAMRLGGEEFVVLLRGPDTHTRAETMRQAIPGQVAHEVEGIETPVTGSMGLVAIPRASKEPLSFDELYSRADQLLYHAKASGRNRSCFERLTMFNEAPPKRRRA